METLSSEAVKQEDEVPEFTQDEGFSSLNNNNNTSNKLLEIEFEAGDHVIRWEMLPIAWPIQIHGIVLEVQEDKIVLVDFGMQAVPESKAAAEGEGDSKNKKKVDVIIKSIENFHKDFQKNLKAERQRLNVLTLTNQEDINKWSKVNYDGGFLGFGGGKGEEDNKAEDSSESNNSQGKEGTRGKTNWWDKLRLSQQLLIRRDKISLQESSNKDDDEKRKNRWWNRLSLLKLQHHPHQQQEESATLIGNNNASNTVHFPEILHEVEELAQDQDKDLDIVALLEKRHSLRMLSLSYEKAEQISDSSGSASNENNESHSQRNLQDQELISVQNDFSDTHKKRIVTEVAADLIVVDEKKEDTQYYNLEINSTSEERQLSIPEGESSALSLQVLDVVPEKEEESKPKEQKEEPALLSTADPTKVVLARTNWLVQHGESILPKYHVLSSNSECMAVFCKTGIWKTLQADVFLHTTAICNAKSGIVLTLGAAASTPLLAPVVGLAGLVAMGAPWAYLGKQKDAIRESQQQMTDAFWAQAEPDVFVACIEEWANLKEPLLLKTTNPMDKTSVNVAESLDATVPKLD